jgi:hypothetical protein
MTFPEFFLIGLAFVVMGVGLAGAFIPALPGAALIWLAALGYGLLRPVVTPGALLFDGWIGGIAMVIITLFTSADFGLEFVVTHYTAHQQGVSKQALFWSMALGVAGMFVFPPIGPIVGALGGLFLVEYRRHARDWRKALRAVWAYLKGFALSVIAEFVLCLTMIGVWALWVAIAAFT